MGTLGDVTETRGRSCGSRWEVAVEGGDLELGELLAAAEAAPPGESVDVIAHDLQKRFGAERVSFLFVDLIGQRLVRLAAVGGGVADPSEAIHPPGGGYHSV